MRKSLLFVWACMGLVCLVSACKTSVKSKEWKLVWVENFDQKNSFCCISTYLIGRFSVEITITITNMLFTLAKKSDRE